MKKFYFKNEEGCLFVAHARLISKLYHGFEKHSNWIKPYYCNDPILKAGRMYGLNIDETTGFMTVVNADTICTWLAADMLEEVATW